MSQIQERLRFGADGTVTALSGKVELGQGLRAAYARVVSEELGVPSENVRVVLGDTDLAPWDMGTFGSMSVEMDGRELRLAAISARRELLSRASRVLSRSPEELALRDGRVVTRDGTAATSIGDLVASAPVEGAVTDNEPWVAPSATCPDTKLGPDAMGIVTGRAQFVADVRIPGMLQGGVLHPAANGASLRSIDRDGAQAVPGVVAIVHDENFVGIVAERRGQVIAAMRELKPTWSAPEPVSDPPLEVPMRSDDGVDDALRGSTRRVRAQYVVPHVAAMPLGPSVGVVDIRRDGADVYASTQAPFRLRDEVARIAGLPPEQVHFHPRATSGGYGRHGAHDAALEAARLSKSVSRPVMVQWNRADELRASPKRPELIADLDAALDASGRIVAWRFSAQTNPYTYEGLSAPSRRPAFARGGSGPPQVRGQPSGAALDWSTPAGRAAMMAGRNAIPGYDVGLAEVALRVRPGIVRTGALRSLGAAPNVFATESMMDELAHAAREDPIAFRLRHTADPRLRRVLETVRDRSGWARRASGGGRALGVAAVVYRATYVAEVVEVSVGSDGTVALERVWCALDAGHIVHPDGARNQVEGAIQMAASWALLEELSLRSGEVTVATWADYPIATFRDAPKEIDIAFIGDDATPSAGLGEPPAVPVAPAIANAVFAACGARIRRLPIRPEAVRAARP